MLASVGRGRCTLLEIKQVYKALSVEKRRCHCLTSLHWVCFHVCQCMKMYVCACEYQLKQHDFHDFHNLPNRVACNCIEIIIIRKYQFGCKINDYVLCFMFNTTLVSFCLCQSHIFHHAHVLYVSYWGLKLH